MKKYLAKGYVESYYLPVILFAICFSWRFLHILDRDICLDEPFTIYYAQKSITDIILLTINGEPTPPLFMMMVHGWIKLFGISALPLRLLPLLFSSLTLVLIYRSVQKLSGVYAALISSTLFLFSSLHFYFALEVRTYSLVSFFTVLIYYLYILLIQNEQKRYLVLFIIIANIGLLMSHYFGGLVIANEVFFFLFFFNNKVLRKKIVTILIATLILCLPILYLLVKQYLVSSQGTWIPPMGEGQYPYFIYFFLNDVKVAKVIECILLFGAIIFIYDRVKKRSNLSTLKFPLLLVLCFVFPYTVMYILSYKSPMFIERYILFNSISLYLFIGILIGKFFNNYWNLQLASLLLISVGMYKSMFINSKSFYYREVKNAVNESLKYHDVHTLIFIHPEWNKLEFSYHFNQSLFKNINKVQDDLLNAKNIFPVFSMDRAVEVIKDKYDSIKTVVFYTDGTDFTNVKIPLDTFSNFTRVDSVFYPQCLHVLVYKKIVK